MYEQTLDIDRFQQFLSQPQDERFYDTFFDLATMNEFKNSRKLPGLPTPPTTPVTPDKANGFQYHMNRPETLPIQNHSVQVVPEMLPTPEEEWSWFTGPKVNNHCFPRNGSANNDVINNGIPYDGFIGPVNPLEQQLNQMKRRHDYEFYDVHGMASHFNNDFEDQFRAAMVNDQQQMMNSIAFEKYLNQQKNFQQQNILNYAPTLSRATHNVLERQRRNDLKVRFSILRDSIPELLDNDKAPKIQILKKAADYLRDLKIEEQRLLVDLELERQRKLILIQRVENLRRHFGTASQ